MSVVVDVTIPPEAFTLHHSLAAEPAMTVEAERLASHSTEGVMPFLWASGGDFDGFVAAMEEDPTVTHVDTIEEGDESVLFQVFWHDEFIDLIDEMIDQHANILEAKANADTWRLTLRFAEGDQVSTFSEYFNARGYAFDVERLFHPTTTRHREFGLTAEQRDTLVTAVRTGYFDVPRSISIEGLADSLGVSSNATSQRIRRATDNLVRHTLLIGDDGSASED